MSGAAFRHAVEKGNSYLSNVIPNLLPDKQPMKKQDIGRVSLIASIIKPDLRRNEVKNLHESNFIMEDFMKKWSRVLVFAVLVLISAVFLRAEFKFGFGRGSEMGSIQGAPPGSGNSGATTTSPGNTPLLSLMPQVYIESVFRRRLAQGSFGADLIISWATVASSEYVKAYQPFYQVYSHNYGTMGDPGVSSLTPELFITADLTYHFPVFGPKNLIDLEVFAGGGFWTMLGDKSNILLPISPGYFAQAGSAIQVNFGHFFLQGRGSYRFFFYDVAAVGGGVTPAPLGNYNIMALVGLFF